MSKKKARRAAWRAAKKAAKARRVEWRPRIGFFADLDQPRPQIIGQLDTYAVGPESWLFDHDALEYDVVAG